MTMFRVPIFTWNMVVTGILILIAFPVLTAALDHAVVRPPPRGAHLHRLRRRRAGALAEPLLVLRPSGGLHPRLAVLRDRHRGHPGLLPKAALRLPGDDLRDDLDRRALDGGVGAPHVHDRRRAAAVLQPDELPHRRADRDQVLQLDRHDVAGLDRRSTRRCCSPSASSSSSCSAA